MKMNHLQAPKKQTQSKPISNGALLKSQKIQVFALTSVHRQAKGLHSFIAWSAAGSQIEYLARV